jgi:phosphoglycolate phosphatase-like HAD superfamily hydrolase
VASSAPSAEIRANLDRHVLLRHFASISGHPHAKSDVLRGLREAHPHARIVFFGDAPADLEAARAAGVGFVAVNPNDELRAMVADWAADFADPGRITELVRRAG